MAKSKMFCAICIVLITVLIAYYIQNKIYPIPRIKYITPFNLRKSYDFIIIGAGTSGSIIASKLTLHKSNPSVLLIEAGDKAATSILSNEMMPFKVSSQINSTNDWFYLSERLDNIFNNKNESTLLNNKVPIPKGKVMGGSSTLNWCMYVRCNKDDYNILWNIKNWKYSDLLNSFKNIENIQFNSPDNYLRGHSGPIKVSKAFKSPILSALFKAAEKVGIKYNEDYNGKNQLGVSLTQYNIFKHRYNSFMSYIGLVLNNRKLKNYHNIKLDILPKYYAYQILFNKPYNDKAIGVKIMSMHNPKIYYTINLNHKNHGEIIISAGSIESPKLLMLSGIGPKKELEKNNIPIVKDLPGVGDNLQDHLQVHVMYKLKDDCPQIPHLGNAKNSNNIWQYINYIWNGHGILNSTQIDGVFFLRTKYGPDFQITFLNGPLNLNKMDIFNLKDKLYNFYHRKNLDSDWDISNNHYNVKQIGMVGILLHPYSIGNISLNSNSPLDKPKVNYNFFSDETSLDYKVMEEGLKIIDKIMSSDELKPFIEKKLELIDSNGKIVDYKGFIKRFFTTVYHPIGTCKMVNSFKQDKLGVVNYELKVNGFNNLRIADASIMPKLTSGNTQVPVYMIGEKASQIILNDWEENHKAYK